MHVLMLAGTQGAGVELDLCFACQGIWLDPKENLQLSPHAVAELFKLLHQHRDDPKQAMPHKLDCPRCRRGLQQGFDLVRTGRYITYRCASLHGRYSSFSSFMIEKGFVRQLSGAEIQDIAKRVGAISCSNCGASVDLRKEVACSHCRTALSLLDPHAVEKALQNYTKAGAPAAPASAPDVADALIALERDRSKARRESQAAFSKRPEDGGPDIDLWAVGIALVGAMLKHY